ncbi:alpha/beta hydrolase [Lacticaseibacillus daqingensis]|uniref:alpha/beta hydrolase n=1 Tax=Lacticaseibacillus daqingensis TaxID=2486014 RepID=UPI000F77AEC0|nr:alpha/beta hydrolase [Lacticaseibacillus daqingensis]
MKLTRRLGQRLVKGWLLLGLLLGSTLMPQRPALSAATVPIVFVHGYGGSARSTTPLIEGLERAGVGHFALRVTVDRTGGLHLAREHGGAGAPLVQVVFQANKAGAAAFTRWLLAVYARLKARYGVRAVSAVGHSLGAYAVIAGPYNGVLRLNDPPHQVRLAPSGQPSQQRPGFAHLLALRRQFQAQRVLNLYGDVRDGSASDTAVTVQSARSLRWVLRDWPVAYQEMAAHGAAAQHSRLNEGNPVVDRALRAFFTAR